MDFDAQHPLLLACRELGAAFDAHDAPMSQRLGVSRTELRLLNRLEDGPQSQVDLAGHLQLTRAAVTVMVDRLTKAGLVQRVPSPVDRRVKLVSLTPQVWLILAQHYRPAGQRVLEMAGALSATELEELTGHVRALAQAIDPRS